MGWTTLPRNYLEGQLDSLGLERTFENGIPDTAENVERLSDYSDSNDDNVCPHSGARIMDGDEIVERSSPHFVLVKCPTCRVVVRAWWKPRFKEWTLTTH